MIEFDTPFRGDDIYTRANAGEVFPHLLTPLSWTLLGPSLERGFMRCMDHDFGAVEAVPGEYVACARMAGRLHLNLSVFRTVAERAPGSSAHDLDIQYFGDAVANGLPAHPTDRAGLAATLKCTTSAVRTMATFTGRVKRETSAARESARLTDDFLADDPTATELLDFARTVLPLHGDTFGSHVTARALTSSAVSMATKALGKKGLSEDEAMRLISNIPDLESAKPSRELQAIAAEMPIGGPLRKAIAGGMGWDELQASTIEGAEVLRDALSAFLRDYGHRGVNEFDPAWRVWGTDQDAVFSLLRPIVATGIAARTAATSDDSSLSGTTRIVVGSARKAISRAENTKDNIIRVTHDLRRLIDAALLDLEPSGLTRDDALMLSIQELTTVAAGGEIPRGVIDRRRREVDEALAVTPGEWSVHELTLLTAAERSNAVELTGLPGSSGKATGPVRILRDVDDEFDDGDVLVAATTDTAWTPLFLAAAAIVTDTGGALSHATIVAREIGIPAVVNTKIGTTELSDGDIVEVDGDCGIISILSRSSS